MDWWVNILTWTYTLNENKETVKQKGIIQANFDHLIKSYNFDSRLAAKDYCNEIMDYLIDFLFHFNIKKGIQI